MTLLPFDVGEQALEVRPQLGAHRRPEGLEVGDLLLELLSARPSALRDLRQNAADHPSSGLLDRLNDRASVLTNLTKLLLILHPRIAGHLLAEVLGVSD